MTTVIRDGLVGLGDGFTRADVVIEGGRVAAITDPRSVLDAAPVDASEALVVPGMVNAHTHSNENWMRGRFDALPLESWLVRAYPPLGAPAQTPREIYVRTAIGALEMLHTGTTCVVDFLFELPAPSEESVGAAVQAYTDVGLRVVLCLAMADRSFAAGGVIDIARVPAELRAQLERTSPPDASAWLSLARRLVERFHRPDDGVVIGLAPSAPHRCSDELLVRSVALAEELDVPVHVHACETRLELNRALAQDGRSVVARLDDLGVLGRRVSLCHGVWADEEDLDTIARRDAVVVHNPLSNLKLGSGTLPAFAARRRGIAVALGTDGMCTADGQDLFQAVKLAATLHNAAERPVESWIRAADAWEMATLGGARAAGDPHLGRIAVGARADLILLDLRHRSFVPLGDPLLHVALQAPAAAVRDVMIGGLWRVRDARAIGVDEPAILAEARELAESWHGRSAHAASVSEQLLPAVSAARERWLSPARAGTVL